MSALASRCPRTRRRPHALRLQVRADTRDSRCGRVDWRVESEVRGEDDAGFRHDSGAQMDERMERVGSFVCVMLHVFS